MCHMTNGLFLITEKTLEEDEYKSTLERSKLFSLADNKTLFEQLIVIQSHKPGQ